MEKSVKIENLLSQIKKLDYEARLYLMERLIKLLKYDRQKSKSDSPKLTELNMLGSEVWQNVDIDKYVQEERQWD